MKKYRLPLILVALLAAFAFSACDKTPSDDHPDIILSEGPSGITYQVLVYSFCDSNGDGIGDFNGITSKLDYLKEMGVSALWLSPIHPASSYHGYDVLDYEAVNPEYGTEADFRNLVDKAREKGISIYLDFVLNHTSKDHPWFLDARKNVNSPYRDYYIFSENPASDISAGKIPMINAEGASGYSENQWFRAVAGSKDPQKLRFTLKQEPSGMNLTVEPVETIENSGKTGTGMYLYYGDGQIVEMYQIQGAQYTTHAISLEFASDWGFLIRTSDNSWEDNQKIGAPAGENNRISWGVPFTVVNHNAQDILLPDQILTWFHSHFSTEWFADLNYGPVATCEQSPAFKAVTKAADKWIGMGVDGLRLDAVKHIYHSQYSKENPAFLAKFYDHCNATYKARGGKGEFYMVSEVLDSYQAAAPYYAGSPACFEFSWWWKLRDRINGNNGNGFAADMIMFRNEYAKYRKDFIGAPKLSNHDEDRAGEELGKDAAKLKLAAAVLLTAPGGPFVYQGEELGYWGSKAGGDEYVRTPVMWTRAGGMAEKKMSGKLDRNMLKASISVEAQTEDPNSILNVYRTFGKARSQYPALAKGDITEITHTVPTIAAWTMSYEGQTVVVVHNFGTESKFINLSSYKLGKCIARNGEVSVEGTKVKLGAYSSAVYLQ